MAKWVYKFHEGSAAMRNLLGGKGCNLAEMTNLGMPIPQGFTVTTEACTEYYNCGKQISQEIQDQIFEAITWLEGINGKKFGDTEDPLLVSVRSGARASMPGMMDTILNLGLNDVAVEGFAKKTGNPRFAYDSYRRFIQMYSDVVMEVPKSYFEKIIDEMKEAKGVHFDTDLTADDLKELAEKVPVPLVLHGGSGTGDENLATACRLGISKVNVANDLFRGAYNKIQEVGMEGNNIYALMPMLQEGYKETAKHFIKILGCADKAWKAEQCVSSGLKQDLNEAK